MSAPIPYDIRVVCQDGSPSLPIGKHKGHSYLSIAYYDPNYCAWVLAERDAKGAVLAFQKWLIQRCEQHRGAVGGLGVGAL